MSGPTIQGIEDLIAKDPDAYWDDDDNSVHQPDGAQPAGRRHPGLRPCLLRHGQAERP